MIIKNNTTKLLVTLSFLLILPFVQKQWFNLYLFNINNISFYSILYFLSGTISPILISSYSLNNFTYYKFNKNKNSKSLIRGKVLFFLVALNLIFLSYLMADYFYINIDLIFNLFQEKIKLQQPKNLQVCFFILFFGILFIFKKFRIFFKKLILVNFILISFFIWYMQIKSIKIDDQFHLYKYYLLDDINLINIFILISIEITYLMWSFISYKNNLSDWTIYPPLKEDLFSISKIFIFYFFITIYYSLF